MGERLRLPPLAVPWRVLLGAFGGILPSVALQGVGCALGKLYACRRTVLLGGTLARPDVGPGGSSKRLIPWVRCQKADVQSWLITAKIVPGV